MSAFPEFEHLTGDLVLAGDIHVADDATPTPGVLIHCSRENLRGMKRLPMYEPVVIVPLSEYVKLAPKPHA